MLSEGLGQGTDGSAAYSYPSTGRPIEDEANVEKRVMVRSNLADRAGKAKRGTRLS